MRGAKVADAAFQFINFLTTDLEGVAIFAPIGSFMPANIKTPYFRRLGTDPSWQVFRDIVVSATKWQPTKT